MNVLNKYLVMMMLLLTFSFAANAQRGDRQAPDPEKMAERETTRMVEKLNLDEIQTAQVQEINLAFALKLQEAHDNNDGNREAIKEIRAAIKTDKTAELKQVLTAEQFTSFETMQAERGKRKAGKKQRQGRS